MLSSNDLSGNIGALYASHQLFQNWTNMSPAQKSLGVVGIGTQLYKDSTGKSLTDEQIPSTQVAGRSPLTVGSALNIASTGVNIVNVASNWSDMNDAQKILQGGGTAANIYQTGKAAGLVSNSPTANGAVQGVGAAGVAYGGYELYKNWGKMSDTQRAISGAQVATGAAAVAGYSAAGPASLAIGTAIGAENTYKQWGKGGLGAATSNAVAVAPADFATMGMASAVAFIGTLAKTGKGKDQLIRDGFRGDLVKKGLINEDYQTTLADGSTVDLGLDGKHGTHAGADGKELKSYETNNASDMDFAATMVGKTLARTIYGGTDQHLDQMGAQIGNNLLGKTGFNADLSEDNFNNVMNNARGMYAKMGINTKDQGYAYVNKMLSEGRIQQADAIGMQQSLNMMYDKNGYKDSYQLLTQGRQRATEVMQSQPPRAATIQVDTSKGTQTSDAATVSNLMDSKDEIRQRNIQRFAAQVAA